LGIAEEERELEQDRAEPAGVAAGRERVEEGPDLVVFVAVREPAVPLEGEAEVGAVGDGVDPFGDVFGGRHAVEGDVHLDAVEKRGEKRERLEAGGPRHGIDRPLPVLVGKTGRTDANHA